MKVKYTENFDKAKKDIEKAIRNSLVEVGENMADEAKSRAPVDTGELRDSIDYYVDQNKVYIGAKAEHAPKIEFGDSSSPARPFLKGSVMDNLESIEKAVVKNITKEGG